ncbi:MAG: DUF805 domain-containing protein [Bacteroidales bacterium]|nr:DUF805 domain-containing protein [Bacteroidales bacterium]
MKWYFKVLKQYADFSGRARRKEYWMFVLFTMIFMVVAMILDRTLGTTFSFYGQSFGYGWIYLIYFLVMILPSSAVGVRRLHDIGKSGWNYLLGFIPFVGAIILFVWACKESQAGENKWGINPVSTP